MANKQQEQEINAIIAERARIQDELDARKYKNAKGYIELQKEEERLSKQIQSHLSEQNKNAKAYNKLISDAEKTEQNISKTITSRLGDLLKGNVAGALNLKNVAKQSLAQKQIANKAKDFATDLKVARGQQQLSVNDYGKLLDLTQGIKDGTIEKGEIDEHIYGLSKKGQDVAFKMIDGAKAIASAKDDEKEATEDQEKAEERINKIRVTGLSIFGALAAVATKFASTIDTIGKSFGSLTVMGEPFKNDLLASSVEATKLGGGMEDVSSITSNLASQFGVNVDEAAKLSDNIFDSSVAMGLSADEGANLFGVLMQTSNLSQAQAEDLAEGAFQLARQAGVAPSAVMKDMAGSTEEIASFTKDGGENIAEAAVQARQMGLSLSTTAKVAEGLLDFENSVNKEIEASVLIGRQLNFQRARQLALSGDIAGATKDIVAQLGSEAEFNELNLIQRKALADSVGVSVSELSKMVGQTDKLSVSGALAAGNFDDISGQEALSNLSKITNQFKSLATTFLNSLGPAIMDSLKFVNDFLSKEENINMLKNAFTGVASAIGMIVKQLPLILSGFAAFAAFKFVGMLSGLKAVFTLMKGKSLMLALSTILKGGAMGGPIGIAATVAAALAGFATFKSLTKSVDDFKSGPGGITHMMGPAGSFSLNPKDSVVATTNRINDGFITGDEGSFANFKELVEAQRDSVVATTNRIKDGFITGAAGFFGNFKELVEAQRDSVVATTNPIPVNDFSLNPRDSVMGTTNRINDFQTGPAGSMGNFEELVEAQRETTQAISNLKVSTTVTNRELQIILDGALNPIGGRPITP